MLDAPGRRCIMSKLLSLTCIILLAQALSSTRIVFMTRTAIVELLGAEAASCRRRQTQQGCN